MKSNHRAAAVIIPASPNGAQSLHRPFQGRHSGCKIFVGRGLAPADRRGGTNAADPSPAFST